MILTIIFVRSPQNRRIKEKKRDKKIRKEEIKQQLIDSVINKDINETEELNKKADKLEKSEDSATIIKQYAEIIRTK